MDGGGLIVLEGAEGVGKTTQLRRLMTRMQRSEIPVLQLREPGGTPAGDEIRRFLLDPRMDIVPRAEALLFMASRAQLVDAVIRPAIAQGQFVLLDRFFLSTYAYQIVGRGLSESEIPAVNEFATGGLTPDLTLLLDLPLGVGMARATARGDHDRIERSGEAFHARVTLAFREFAHAAWQARHPEAGPVVQISGEGSESEVTERIWRRLAERWPETFPLASESYS